MGIGLVKHICFMLAFMITRHLTAQPFQNCSNHRLRVMGLPHSSGLGRMFTSFLVV